MASSTVNGDAALGPIYFWREFEEPYGFLSQWYDDPFEVNGVTYQSAEMWMMVQKALLFGDEVHGRCAILFVSFNANKFIQEIAKKMMQTTVPKEHKALGRKAKGFDGKVWDESMYWPLRVCFGNGFAYVDVDKSRIVEEGNFYKFTKSKNDPGMTRKLLDTGDRELVEVRYAVHRS